MEAALAEEEVALAREAARLKEVGAEVLALLQKVKAAAMKAKQQGSTDPALGELASRVSLTTIPPLSIDAERNASIDARAQAIQARERFAEVQRQMVQSHAAALSRLSGQLGADGAALETLAARAKEKKVPPPPPPAKAVAAPPALPPKGPGRAGPAAAKPKAEEPRRDRPRVRMQAAIDLHSETNFFNGFSTNISDGGLFIATTQNVTIGTEVDVSFTLPGGKPVTTRGVVRWVREVNDQTPEIFPGVGGQFVNLSAELQEEIHAFVEGREPMFYPG